MKLVDPDMTEATVGGLPATWRRWTKGRSSVLVLKSGMHWLRRISWFLRGPNAVWAATGVEPGIPLL